MMCEATASLTTMSHPQLLAGMSCTQGAWINKVLAGPELGGVSCSLGLGRPSWGTSWKGSDYEQVPALNEVFTVWTDRCDNTINIPCLRCKVLDWHPSSRCQAFKWVSMSIIANFGPLQFGQHKVCTACWSTEWHFHAAVLISRLTLPLLWQFPQSMFETCWSPPSNRTDSFW
jgi:hypothetical protein